MQVRHAEQDLPRVPPHDRLAQRAVRLEQRRDRAAGYQLHEDVDAAGLALGTQVAHDVRMPQAPHDPNLHLQLARVRRVVALDALDGEQGARRLVERRVDGAERARPQRLATLPQQLLGLLLRSRCGSLAVGGGLCLALWRRRFARRRRRRLAGSSTASALHRTCCCVCRQFALSRRNKPSGGTDVRRVSRRWRRAPRMRHAIGGSSGRTRRRRRRRVRLNQQIAGGCRHRGRLHEPWLAAAIAAAPRTRRIGCHVVVTALVGQHRRARSAASERVLERRRRVRSRRATAGHGERFGCPGGRLELVPQPKLEGRRRHGAAAANGARRHGPGHASRRRRAATGAADGERVRRARRSWRGRAHSNISGTRAADALGPRRVLRGLNGFGRRRRWRDLPSSIVALIR
mmetsp:Transcript_14730/g.51286  ORF Transcript_14730/g.51286 Transcript_14730/m.51286 type:complete len:403 (+) Transcript_14730:1298-2506(+)